MNPEPLSVLHSLLALRPQLFYACVLADFETIRRDRSIRAPSAAPGGVMPEPSEAIDAPGSDLHGLVMFWPGTPHGPIAAGRDRIERQRQSKGLLIVRTRFMTTLQRNPARDCHVTVLGTAGAFSRESRPAWQDRPRVVSIHGGHWNAAEVQQVAFTAFVDLPLDTVWAESLAGPWQPL